MRERRAFLLPDVRERTGKCLDGFRRDPAVGPDWLARTRESAVGRFLERGFPSTRDEDWRFTNVAPIAALKLVRPSVTAVDRAAIAPYLFDGLPTIVTIMT